MSRYVQVELDITDRTALLEDLAALGLVVEDAGAGERLMLEGSLECAGEPVEIRLSAGTSGAVEDFGFVPDQGRYRLVCGEVDRGRLDERLVAELRRREALRRTAAAAQDNDLSVEQHLEPDGSRRLVLKRK